MLAWTGAVAVSWGNRGPYAFDVTGQLALAASANWPRATPGWPHALHECAIAVLEPFPVGVTCA
jgi:hypothetical protein